MSWESTDKRSWITLLCSLYVPVRDTGIYHISRCCGICFVYEMLRFRLSFWWLAVLPQVSSAVRGSTQISNEYHRKIAYDVSYRLQLINRTFATRVLQLKIWHFSVIGIERNVCRCTLSSYSVITQFAKLAAGEQLCRRCTHRKW
jgi:hypothetical protein